MFARFIRYWCYYYYHHHHLLLLLLLRERMVGGDGGQAVRKTGRQASRQTDQQRDRYPPVVKHTTQTRGSSSSRSRRIIEYPLKIKSMTEDAQKEKSARDSPCKNRQLQNNQWNTLTQYLPLRPYTISLARRARRHSTCLNRPTCSCVSRAE